MKNINTLAFILVLLILGANFLLRIPFAPMPLERDEGEYAYIANVIDGGGLPYRDAFDQKPPGVFYLYYLLLHVFKEDVFGLRFFVILYNILTIFFVYRIGALVYDSTGNREAQAQRKALFGFVAALIFAIISSERRLLGFSANTELFMLAPLTAGFYYALSALENRSQGLFFLSGVLCGFAVLFKQPAAFGFAAVLAYVVYKTVLEREGFRPAVIRPAAVIGGFVLPLAITAGYFLYKGAYADFQYQVFWHNVGYAGIATRTQDTLRHVFSTMRFLFQSQAVFWLLLIIGIPAALTAHRKSGFPLVVLWLIAAAAAVSLGKRFTLHYFEQITPALALLSAAGLFSIADIYARFLKRPLTPFLWISLIASGVIALPAYANYRYFSYTPAQLTTIIYGGNPFNEAVTAGLFVRENTQVNDKIFVIGSEPQILYYASRASASKYIFSYPLTGAYSDSLTKQKEAVAAITAAMPKSIVYVNYPMSLGISKETPLYFFEEMSELLIERYDIAGAIDPSRPDAVIKDAELAAALKSDPNFFNATRIFIYIRKN